MGREMPARAADSQEMKHCTFCNSKVADDDHRCQHCGRRLYGGLAPLAHRQAAAPAITELERRETPAAVATAPPRVATQTTLSFSREGQKVVAIAETAASARPARRKPASRGSGSGAHPQQRFSFEVPDVPPPATGVLYSNAKVATPLHRSVAAMLDVAMMLIGAGLTFLAIYWSGGKIPLHRTALPIWGGIVGLVTLLYRLLWCLCGVDGPGFRWTGLRTLNFDGNRPTDRQRVHRLLAGCLSVLAAGLGLIWALADEEKLTWHDHISRTFPALDDSASQRRR